MFLKKHKLDSFIENTTTPNRFSSNVNCIISDNSSIIIGGSFTDYKRKGISRIASLIDESFCINSSYSGKFSIGSNILSLDKQSDGKILVGGSFAGYAETTGRSYLLRFNSNGTIDSAFCVNATDSKFDNAVYIVKVQPDGKILVGGIFSNYAATGNRSRLIRLNSDGTLDTAFCTNAVDSGKFNSVVNTIDIQSDGKILIGGAFSNYAGTLNRNSLIRLNSNGTLDTTFCTNASDGAKFNGAVDIVKVQSDGKILIGGDFSSYAGTTNRNMLIRLNSDGTLDTAFCTNAVDSGKFNSVVNTINTQSDGKILVGGGFVSYAGTASRNRLIRLNSDGTLDTTFCTNASDGNKFSGEVYAINIQSDGKILIGGAFINHAAISGRDYIVRLNSDGTLDTDFCRQYVDKGNQNFSGEAYSIKNHLNNLVIGGSFTNFEGLTGRDYLVYLDEQGIPDSNFCSNAIDGSKFNARIYSIAVQSDSKILIGGEFTNYAGTLNRSYLIRLNSDGTLDTAFCTNAVDGAKFNSTVFDIAIQSDGKILVGGIFTNYNETTNRNRLVRLNSDGTLDSSFCVNSSDGNRFNNVIYTLAVQSDGKILVGGGFTNYFTAGRNYFVRLNAIGGPDTTFCLNASDSSKFSSLVFKTVVLSSGQILVGGNFINYATATNRNRLICLESNGTLSGNSSTFVSNAVDGNRFNGAVRSIEQRPDGNILIGGEFTNYAATGNRNRLVLLSSTGILNTTFCTNAVDGAKFDSFVYSTFSNSYNYSYIAGTFTSYLCGIRSNRTAQRFIKINSLGISK